MWFEDKGRTYKRNRAERDSSPGVKALQEEKDRKLQATLHQLIQDKDREVRRLSTIVSENQNTRCDIKDSTLTIRSLICPMTTRDMLSLIECRPPYKGQAVAEIALASSQTENSEEICKREIGVQTGITSADKNESVRMKQVKAVDTLEDFQRIKNHKCPEDLYTVKHVEGFPALARRNFDLVV